MSTEMSPRELAERRIAEEEAAEREARIQAIEDAEEERRRREEDDARRERKRLEAVAEFDRLARDRGELEDVAQQHLNALVETFAAISRIDTQQLSVARAADRPVPYTTFRGLWQGWAAGAILGHPDHYGNMTLRQRDGLAATSTATNEENGRVPKANVSPSSSGLTQKCAGRKADGSACGLPPMGGSVFCSQHAPDRAESRSQAARVAGRARHGLEPTPATVTGAPGADR